MAFLSQRMKKNSHHGSSESSRRNRRNGGDNSGSKGRWEFSLGSENLFALGTADSARRVVYYNADGEIRVLPL